MENDQLASARSHVAERGVSVMELAGLVEKLKGKVPLAEIRSLYACWIEHHPADPMLYAVLFNYSVVLTDAGGDSSTVLDHYVRSERPAGVTDVLMGIRGAPSALDATRDSRRSEDDV